jgi:uncharacterized radical SAM superfamily protein
MIVYYNKTFGIGERWAEQEIDEFEEKVKEGLFDKVVFDISDYNVLKNRYNLKKEKDDYILEIKDKETKEIIFNDKIENYKG